MIRLIIIIAVVLFFIWVISEMLKPSKKALRVKKSKILPGLLILAALIALFFILPRFGIGIMGLLQKFALPLVSLLRTFIPF